MKKIRTINTSVEGISIDIYDTAAILHSEKEMRVLSSAVVNGGYANSGHILNMSVPSGYCSDTPSKDIINTARDCRCNQVVGMMTAADVRNTVVEESDGVVVMATAGTSNAATPGEEALPWKGGTVNICVVCEQDLTPACMANAIITVTEAKTHVFRILDIRSTNSGKPATGTTTDSVAIATLSKGDAPACYASTATELGRTIATLVIKAILCCLEKYNGKSRKRTFVKRLAERKISCEETCDCMSRILKTLFDTNATGDDISAIHSPLFPLMLMAIDLLNIRMEQDGNEAAIRDAKEIGRMVALFRGGASAISTYEECFTNDIVQKIVRNNPWKALFLGFYCANVKG